MLTSENIEIMNGEVKTGDKEQLFDGKYDHTMVEFDKTGGDGMQLNFNMGQINCVNKIDMYFDSESNEQLSLTFTCTSSECTCAGKESSRWCLEFRTFIVTSEETLPEDLPTKTDCKYGDTATLFTTSTTPNMRFFEIVMTGYQPEGKYLL